MVYHEYLMSAVISRVCVVYHEYLRSAVISRVSVVYHEYTRSTVITSVCVVYHEYLRIAVISSVSVVYHEYLRHADISSKMGQITTLLIKEIYYPILAAVGVPANLMTIVILSRGNCGLSNCISVYMVAMATADLLVMIINIIFSYHFPLSFLSHTPVCRFILYMATVTLDLSVWFTVSFTFDRFVALCCRKFKTNYCTERTTAAVITTVSVLIFLKGIPILFVYSHEQIINKVQWGCRSSEAFLSSPPAIPYGWFHGISLIWLPFTLIALFNSLTIRRIAMANRTRRRLRDHNSENQSDPEIGNRRKSIILLFTISGSFILLWLTTSVSFVTTRLTNTNYYRGDRTNPAYIAAETGAMLKYLSCCPNTCIYAATQRKFREELKKLLKSPWTLILRLVKNERNAN
ncbi:probable G-protein coupled receptor 139 [Heptranchias perlo]|uniref:probable G-protein coupled receptor 139 n=1 Tax=Heptranchias perlo TaxID=212740 RepID=UPI003559FD54